jgi:HSP20 family protein
MLAHCTPVATVAAGLDEEVTVVSLTFDPFREMDRLTSQLVGTGGTSRGPRWMPMDLYRVDDHFVVTVDLPGVDPGSIDMNVDGSTLTIRAERSLRSDEGVQWLAQERPVGSYLRQLHLGDGLDVEKIQASYDAGVLTVTIPVAERARPRRITVEAGGGRTAVDANRTVQGEVTSSS